MGDESPYEWEEAHPQQEILRVLVAGALPVRTTRIDVGVEPSPTGYRVTARYRVEVIDPSRGSYLLLDYTTCPFPIVDVETVAGEVRDAGAELQERVFVIDCARPLEWSITTIRVVMEWPADLAVDGARVAFLVAPDLLPRVVTGPTESIPPQQPVHVEAIPPGQFTRVGLGLDTQGPTSGDESQLQVALIPADGIRLVEVNRILFGGDAVAGASEATLARAAREFETILGFLSAQFGVEPTLRLAVIADSRALELFEATGVVVASEPRRFGIGTDDLWFIRSQGVSHVAGIWWGAGVRMHGELGIAVAQGIAQAMVFRRLRVDQNQRDLRIVIQAARQMAETPLAGAASCVERVGKLGAEIALRLFEAMERGPAALAELRTMTREYWGHEVVPERVLRRLAAAGVSLPPTRPRQQRGTGGRWRLRRRRRSVTGWLASRPIEYGLRGPRHVVQGIPVHLDVSTPSAGAELLARLGDAIKLLEEVDAPHFRRLLNDACRVLILDGAYAHYSPDANVIAVGPPLLLEAPVEVVAAALVHEGTHARVDKWVPYSPRVGSRIVGSRIERLCLREELRFIERFAAAGGRARAIVSYLARWRRAHKHPLPTRAERLARVEAHLQAQDVPRWARLLTRAVVRAGLWRE
jgi:hypothetical protein